MQYFLSDSRWSSASRPRASLGRHPRILWVAPNTYKCSDAGSYAFSVSSGEANQAVSFAQPEFALALARIETHYFVNRGFFRDESQLLDGVESCRRPAGPITGAVAEDEREGDVAHHRGHRRGRGDDEEDDPTGAERRALPTGGLRAPRLRAGLRAS